MLIRKRRQELGLKVYELANKVGVNPVYITQIEKHNKLPAQEVFIKIIKALNMDLALFADLWLNARSPIVYKSSSKASQSNYSASSSSYSVRGVNEIFGNLEKKVSSITKSNDQESCIKEILTDLKKLKSMYLKK